MDEGYFRYSWHPFIMTTEILIFLFIALFFMFKFSYLALNQAILLGFFNATAFTDLHSGKRNMLILDKIKAISPNEQQYITPVITGESYIPGVSLIDAINIAANIRSIER